MFFMFYDYVFRPVYESVNNSKWTKFLTIGLPFRWSLRQTFKCYGSMLIWLVNIKRIQDMLTTTQIYMHVSCPLFDRSTGRCTTELHCHRNESNKPEAAVGSASSQTTQRRNHSVRDCISPAIESARRLRHQFDGSVDGHWRSRSQHGLHLPVARLHFARIWTME